MPSDKFDPITHTYTRDGEWIPSCTKILDFYFPQTAPPKRLEHARLRGQVVHEMILAREQGGEPFDIELYEGLTETEVYMRFAAYEKFRREVPFKVKVAERWRIASYEGYLYGVTPDLEVEIEGRNGVIECKNTYSPEVTHSLQTAAQAIAIIRGQGKTLVDYESFRRYALYLKADGTYRLRQHASIHDLGRWGLLLAAFHLKQELAA